MPARIATPSPSAQRSLATGGSVTWDRVQRRGIGAHQIPRHRQRAAEAPPSQRHSENDRTRRDLPDAVKSQRRARFPGARRSRSIRPRRRASRKSISTKWARSIPSATSSAPASPASSRRRTHLLLAGQRRQRHRQHRARRAAGSRARHREVCCRTGRSIRADPRWNSPRRRARPFVTALATDFGAMPPDADARRSATARAISDFTEHANVVRVMVGEASGAPESHHRLA